MRSLAKFMTVTLTAVIMSGAAWAANVTMFAAASLSSALPEIAAAYQKKTGKTVTFSFAASSVLARQIEASPGADVFMSADADWMDYLERKNLIQPSSRKTLLSSRLVLIAPAAAPVSLKIAPQFDLAGALKGGRLAVADPASVPAGKYAKASLTALGVWPGVESKLAAAENVRVALAYVARGETPLGIVYRTDALAEPKVKIVDTFPDKTHPPIVYPVAMIKDARPDAKAFLTFLEGREAAAIFVKYGFEVAGK
ncbi:molybdate ABC transporter substrate-binding protein [Rhizomicrobium electricum]|uniref:Molybdate ABC transporter substrate-binding protein n=1 Tax=Rhizomicrobium electricum TaxID=480070 RepID=A0ABN1DYU0_9PROT|nr:molybdate ABC transporter substrate-binding protein [Rhizomicrobium electricum]NIJ47216.1 molybdate transport system substrate-binding protein [Rhizomicrobium electricum]